MKRLSLMLLMLLLLNLNPVQAETIRAVQLPLIITPQARVNEEIAKQIEVKISRAMFIPATSNINTVEYIPSSQSKDAWLQVMRSLGGFDNKSKLIKSMRPLAERLKADFIVCTVIYKSHQEPEGLAGFGDKLKSEVVIDMIIYDKITDELINRSERRNYNDDFNALGMKNSLAIECITALIDDMKIKDRLLRHVRK